jgi:DNA-directed RNA polymerase sigma subunit (sigma70/sigma32)
MELTELEIAVLRDRYAERTPCTPEQLAERLGITLGEVREAEKTALRKLDDPAHASESGLKHLDLTPTERAVLTARYCHEGGEPRTPEQLAEEMGVTLVEVLEAEKQAMRKLEDPAHASRESLHALGLD